MQKFIFFTFLFLSPIFSTNVLRADMPDEYEEFFDTSFICAKTGSAEDCKKAQKLAQSLIDKGSKVPVRSNPLLMDDVIYNEIVCIMNNFIDAAASGNFEPIVKLRQEVEKYKPTVPQEKARKKAKKAILKEFQRFCNKARPTK